MGILMLKTRWSWAPYTGKTSFYRDAPLTTLDKAHKRVWVTLQLLVTDKKKKKKNEFNTWLPSVLSWILQKEPGSVTINSLVCPKTFGLIPGTLLGTERGDIFPRPHLGYDPGNVWVQLSHLSSGSEGHVRGHVRGLGSEGHHAKVHVQA